MKKNYISPLAADVDVEAVQMLAASLGIHGDKELDTSKDGAQLSGDRRGEWGDFWK